MKKLEIIFDILLFLLLILIILTDKYNIFIEKK